MQQYEEIDQLFENQARQIAPPEFYQLAESHCLGKPTAYYKVKSKQKTLRCALVPGMLSGVFFSGALFSVWRSFSDGDVSSHISVALLLLLPLLWLGYLCGKRAVKLYNLASASVCFCQLGLLYQQRGKALTVLHWEDIERASAQVSGLWIPCCRLLLADGKLLTLNNAVGGNLSEQINRRVRRARKKHQHPDQPFITEAISRSAPEDFLT